MHHSQLHKGRLSADLTFLILPLSACWLGDPLSSWPKLLKYRCTKGELVVAGVDDVTQTEKFPFDSRHLHSADEPWHALQAFCRGQEAVPWSPDSIIKSTLQHHGWRRMVRLFAGVEPVSCWGAFCFGISSLLQAPQRNCFPYVEIPTLPERHSVRKWSSQCWEEDVSVLHKAVLLKSMPVFLFLHTCFKVGVASKKCPGAFYFKPFQIHLKACCQKALGRRQDSQGVRPWWIKGQ